MRSRLGHLGIMLRSRDVYDECRVQEIGDNVAAAIDAATFGIGTWDQVPAILSEAFPGSFSGLYNMNFPESRLNFLSWQNMDPAFVESYAEHYAYINPWGPYWTSIKGTTIAASELVYPARSFSKSEFYNDWLMPQDGAEAGVGMKIVGERDEAVHLLLHFPLVKSSIYDQAALKVMAAIRGGLERSVNVARLLRKDVETTLAKAALVERTQCGAFIVEGDRRLREVNTVAESLFVKGDAISVRNGRCYLTHKPADERFGDALKSLASGKPTLASRIAFRTPDGVWQVSLATVPFPEPPALGGLTLLPPNRLVLVLIVDLNGKDFGNINLTSLAALYRLTPSEIALCKRMLLGDTVAESAEQLRITQGTARTRLKTILQKTGFSRQTELMLALAKLS
jgi:DNA-binding CsgD family transcriptional regulator